MASIFYTIFTMRAERKSLSDFMAEQEGSGPYPVVLDLFEDVNDDANPDQFDRAVIGLYDTEKNTFYIGAIIIDFGDFHGTDAEKRTNHWRVKEYFRTALASRDVAALLRVPGQPGQLPTLSLPEGDVELPEKPVAGEPAQEEEEATGTEEVEA